MHDYPKDRIDLTIKTFSPRCGRIISEAEAVEIIEDVVPLAELTIDLHEEQVLR